KVSVVTNQPPVIVSQPVTTAVSGQTYQYPVKAIDPNNDSLTYSLLAGPQGMTIDPASGRISLSLPSGGGHTSGPPPSNGLRLTAAGAAEGFALTDFARAFRPFFGIGPLGIAFPSSGGVLVSDYSGDLRRFPSDSDGQSAANFLPIQH